jgi:hypothetical protein
MKKLRTVLAAALLTFPVLTLNASSLGDSPQVSDIKPTHSVTNTCYTYFMGRWWAYPC